jgi:hypothetical protein
MMEFLFFLGFVVTMVMVTLLRAWLQVALLRRQGLYPAAGRATMADVKRLARSGRRRWLAVRCYREVHPKKSLKEAKRVVDELALAG